MAQQRSHSCGSDEHYQYQLSQDPSLRDRETAFNESARTNQVTSRAAVYTIPVVFHVMHTGGQDNISREQILDQMRILNQDYNLKNTNLSKIRSVFAGKAVDCQIQFELATIDPNGNCTDGINRIYSTTSLEVDQTTEACKHVSGAYWDYTKYLNIWVVNSIVSTGTGGTILGYAVFPWTSQAPTDGIVVRHDRVGTIGTALGSADSGRVLTHEIGHWLGLFHTFQGGCTDGDQCGDTPPVNGTFTNASCPASGNSCNTDNPDLLDMWENYMDYSDGKCQAMFTANQKTRMLNTFSQYRTKISSASNLIATGVTAQTIAPKAYFTSSTRIICAGMPVKFYDMSCKATVAARSWSLPGANTPSPTEENPVVIYQTPGKYNVSLTVSNTKGSNNATENQYIEVVSPIASLKTNYQQTFESGTLATMSFTNNSPSPYLWTQTSGTGYQSNSCIKAPISSSDADGAVYSFTMPPIDLSILKGKNPKLSFLLSYCRASSTTDAERMTILLSKDCGASWTKIWERDYSGMEYVGASPASNFTPTATNQWRIQLQSLTAFDTVTSALIKFEAYSKAGNPLYIDNINVGQYTVGVSKITAANMGLTIFPVPASQKAQARFETFEASMVNASLYDVNGKLVKNIINEELQPGQQQLWISSEGLVRNAIYWLRITTPYGSIAKPLTFAD